MSDAAAFAIALVVAFWFGAPWWVKLLFAAFLLLEISALTAKKLEP